MSDPRPIWPPLWEASVSNLSWDFYGSCHLPQWCRPRTVVTRLLVNDSEFEIQTVRNAVIFFRFRWNGNKIVGYPKMDSQATIQRMTFQAGRSLCRLCRTTSGDSSTGSLPHWRLWISNLSCSLPFLNRVWVGCSPKSSGLSMAKAGWRWFSMFLSKVTILNCSS